MDGLSDDLNANIASLRRYAMVLSSDPSEADDLVQECLARALSYAQRGHEIRNLRAFLFTVLHNLWATSMKAAPGRRNSVPIEDVAEQLPSRGNQESRAELRVLQRVLQELPEEQRRVLLLVAVEGFAYREAAEIMGVPIGTIMSRLARARRTVIERMSAESTPAIRRVK